MATHATATKPKGQSALEPHHAAECEVVATSTYLSLLHLAHRDVTSDLRQEPGAVCVGKAGISLSVKVRPGQSRADRPAASFACVVVTRGTKRKQQVYGVVRYESRNRCVMEAELETAPVKAVWTASVCEMSAAPSGAKRTVTCTRLIPEPKRADRVRWLVTSGSSREAKSEACCCRPCRQSYWSIVSMKRRRQRGG